MNEVQKIFLLSILFDEAGVPQLVDQEEFLKDFPHLFKPSSPEETQEQRLIRTLATARAAGFEDKSDEEAIASLMAAPTSFPEEKAKAVVAVVRGVSYYFDLALDTPKVNEATIAALIAENITLPEVAALLSDEDNAAPDAQARQLTAIQMHLADQVTEASADAPTETPATETPVAEEEAAPVTDTPVVEPIMETPTEESAAPEEENDDVPVTAEEESSLPVHTVDVNLSVAVATAGSLQQMAVVSGANVAVAKAIGQQAQLAMEALGKVVKMAEGSQEMNGQVLEAISASIPAQV